MQSLQYCRSVCASCAPYITSPVALYHSRLNDWCRSLSDGLFHIIVMAFCFRAAHV